MWTILKNNYKTILTALGFLFVAIVAALLFEEHYRRFVRFIFKFFNGENIRFVGKNFHLFASGSFVGAFGLFTSLTFLLLKSSSQLNRLKKAFLTIIIFSSTTILISALDSTRLIIECTACDDGIRRLPFNQVTYDLYFIISLSTAAIYLLTTYLLERKQFRSSNKTI